jgi:hypothetical protein
VAIIEFLVDTLGNVSEVKIIEDLKAEWVKQQPKL